MSEAEEDAMCEAHTRRIARLESEVEELRSANELLRRVAEFLAERPHHCGPVDPGRPPRRRGPG
ncbi:hypothetical protein [Streptomyces sp. NRRL S-350]|uniref:hypothetical protein n=1 Tax=Streptomyces sp. NRRL S-350 TaxID=1463902 RepID=UPI0004C018D6|nr:hypothetical protein [Streptomyces sp. NRRL S-350]